MKDINITNHIIAEFYKDIQDRVSSDVIIIGAGPSGLVASYLLAQDNFKVTVFEKRNQPGGGIWGGGMMFNQLVLPDDLQDFLNQMSIKFKLHPDNLISVDSVHFSSALLYHATEVGVKIFNNIGVEDLLVVDDMVRGVVINWNDVIKNKIPIDPLTFEAKAVVDSTGHPADGVEKLARRGLVEISQEFPMNADVAEKFVVEATGQLYPGLYVSGMAATAAKGGPRMGPIFGGMIKSGIKIANLIKQTWRSS
ncbi:MAG: ribulose-1,5-biphosphate synthetase [Desulfuromonas sp. SDB]|nr:MAG: ribulose-1,5-biphosphate synthetase [Desulfuromonas sp. SDB]